MASANYIQEDELEVVQRLMRFLNENMELPNCPLSAEVVLTDQNGDCVGRLEWERSSYVLRAAGDDSA